MDAVHFKATKSPSHLRSDEQRPPTVSFQGPGKHVPRLLYPPPGFPRAAGTSSGPGGRMMARDTPGGRTDPRRAEVKGSPGHEGRAIDGAASSGRVLPSRCLNVHIPSCWMGVHPVPDRPPGGLTPTRPVHEQIRGRGSEGAHGLWGPNPGRGEDISKHSPRGCEGVLG